MNALRDIFANRCGATAAEFAMVLPLLIIFLLGIIDVGRLMYVWNEAEKATQMGVRLAVVTKMIPQKLAAEDFTTDSLAPGASIPTSAFSHAECVKGKCQSCAGTICSKLTSDLGYDAPSFQNVVSRMADMLPIITEDNVQIDYDSADIGGPNGNNLGYAGNPTGSDIAPLVTVKLKDLRFQPLLTILFGASLALPDFKATLTTEDDLGSQSN